MSLSDLCQIVDWDVCEKCFAQFFVVCTIVSHLALQSAITYDFHLRRLNFRAEWAQSNAAKMTKIDSLSQYFWDLEDHAAAKFVPAPLSLSEGSTLRGACKTMMRFSPQLNATTMNFRCFWLFEQISLRASKWVFGCKFYLLGANAIKVQNRQGRRAMTGCRASQSYQMQS